MGRSGRFSLEGKNVIVTGASGGLGRALTIQLIQRYGCRVLGVARSRDRLEALHDALGERKDCFMYRVADVSQRESWTELADFVRAGSFDADVVVCNAGMLPPFERFGDLSAEEIEQSLALNLHGVMYAAAEFLPLLEQKSGTALINIASADALCPLAGTSLYSAAKSAVCALSEAMREEYRGRVYIPAVCPGFIRTDIMRHQNRAVSPLVDRFSMSPERAARVMLRRANAGRSRIVLGADAHLMSMAYRIAPVWSLRLSRWLMKASGLELFADIFSE